MQASFFNEYDWGERLVSGIHLGIQLLHFLLGASRDND